MQDLVRINTGRSSLQTSVSTHFQFSSRSSTSIVDHQYLVLIMAKTLRPSVEHFRKAGWLPVSKEAYDLWMDKMNKKILPVVRNLPGPGDVATVEAPTLLAPVQEFKDFIETNTVVYTEFIRMFDGMTESPKTYQELLLMYNEIFRQAPDFGSLGPPMYMIMARIMNTQGGFSAFTKQILNQHYKNMLKTWELFLLSTDSRSVLTTEEGGWFSQPAMTAMMEEFPDRSFEEVFICSPEEPYYGFTSYEDFFIRRFRNPEIDRPTEDITKLELVSAACESALYAIQDGVQKTDELFIKDEAYSLIHLLANDESVDSFVGGTVIQTFLNTTGYHRWHAPVNGVIRKIVDVPGTYFAQAPYTIGDPIPDDDSQVPPYLQSLRYFANTAARQLIFIDADNTAIGLMCFIAIGMTEISTCQATVFEGQHVNRGEELGMFHFGGSSSAMVFNKGAGIKVDGDYTTPGVAIPINKPIAVANLPAA